MFAGLDDIDWASMKHAYGPAAEIPDVIRGLVSEKKKVRAWAQDCMWGGIHHQGDVYECTLRCVPFLLEAAALPDAPGRPEILRLLASIGGAHADDAADGLRHDAQVAVAQGFPTFVALLDDRKKGIRRVVPDVLLVARDRTADTVRLLRERLPLERDAEARTAIVGAVGTIALRARDGLVEGADAAELDAWFAVLTTGSKHADVRMAALTERLRLTDESDDDLVETLYDMVCATDAVDLRDLREALGDRVVVRNTLLTRIAREGPDDRRMNAMWAASGGLSHWRGDYTDLLTAFADLLPGERTRPIALRLLTGDAWPLTAPVADHLARFIERSLGQGAKVFVAQEPGFWSFEGGPIWALTKTLAQLRDPRAIPLVAQALEDDLPLDCQPPLWKFGAEVAPLFPLLRKQIRRAIASGDHKVALDLLWELKKVGPAAIEALPEVVALLPHDSFLGAPFQVLAALGPDARSAAPLVRERLVTGSPRTVAHAATALGVLEGKDAEGDLRALLAHDDAFVRRHAANALRALGTPAAEVLHAYEADDYWSLRSLGPAAEPLVPRMRAALPQARFPETVLTAMWHITGDTDTLLPELIANWQAGRERHVWTVKVWAEMGPAAAAVEPLLRAELANPVRSTYSGTGYWSAAIESDEEYLGLCRKALDAVTGTV